MSSPSPQTPVPGQRYKFVVRTAEEAAAAIRSRLGEKARVISVRQVEGEGLRRFLSSPKLEIIAEIPPDPLPAPPVPEPLPAPEPTPEAAAQASAPPVSRAGEYLRRRSKRGRPATGESPAEASDPGSPADGTLDRLRKILLKAGLPQDFIERVSDRQDWRSLGSLSLHSALAKSVFLLREAVPKKSRQLSRRVAFFGTPGAGVTTALCKQLAADVFFNAHPACVMKLDGDEPNSTEGLATFCEALGVPLLRTPQEMIDVPEGTTVYFDVPGLVLEEKRTKKLKKRFDDLAIQSRVLVVNSAYDRLLIQNAYTSATALRATHVVFTHLDELPRCGKLWEFALDGGLLPLFLSTGQNVASDCERQVMDFLVNRTISAVNS